MSANQEEQGSTQNAPDNSHDLQKSVAAAKKVVEAQGAAAALKEQAAKALNPKERMRLLKEAYDKEVEAHGQSKFAKRLQSGPWQGAAAGGGIGGGVAMGLGTVVGTLVGGVASVPTVLLGGLVGAGVGGIHGPFIKLGGGKDGKKGEGKALSEEEVREQAVKEAERMDQAVERSASEVPQPPPELEDASMAESVVSDGPPKRKPKKLEVRGGKQAEVAQLPSPEPERKRPKKLQVRSAGTNVGA